MVRVRFRIQGMARLERDFKRLGKVPATAVNKGAKAAGKIMYEDAQKRAPVDIGNLKMGLKLIREKKKKATKCVYFVVPSKSFNRFFKKPYANDTKEAYYPASQEWGFTVHGHYTPGFRYLKNAVDENKGAMEKAVVTAAQKQVDKILRG